MQLMGWGRFPRTEGQVSVPRTEAEIAALIAGGPLIARGMGRASGDAAIGAHALSTARMNHMLDFDPETGQLVAEAAGTPIEIPEDLCQSGYDAQGHDLAGWFQFQPWWDELCRDEPEFLN